MAGFLTIRKGVNTGNKICILAVLVLGLGIFPVRAQVSKSRQAASSPESVLAGLMQGNARFVANQTTPKNLPSRREVSAKGQFPLAVILSCMDSRVVPESIFDQGLGDVFVGRVAGNVEDRDQLGSMEFATQLAGAKLVMVLGHTSCGAVKGACNPVRMGHLTGILKKIRPSVKAVQRNSPGLPPSASNLRFVNKVAEENSRRVLQNIRRSSPILAGLEKSGQIKMVSAMYDLETGRVTLVD